MSKPPTIHAKNQTSALQLLSAAACRCALAAILGGTCSLIGTSTNLVISGLQEERYAADPRASTTGIFNIAPLGIAYAAWCVARPSHHPLALPTGPTCEAPGQPPTRMPNALLAFLSD